MLNELKRIMNENSIQKIILGKKKLYEQIKFVILFIVSLLISILYINICLTLLNLEKYILVVTSLILIFLTFIFSYIYNKKDSDFIESKKKTSKYKPVKIMKINITAMTEINWDDSVLKQRWFDVLYKKFKNVSTQNIKYFLTTVKYETKEEPKINYSNFIGSCSIILSLLLAFLSTFQYSSFQKLEIINIVFLALFFCFIILFIIYQNYFSKKSKYKLYKRWQQAFEYILYKRKIE